MEIDIIQERFNSYIEILQKIHSLDHDIDASINETEITDIEEKRSKLKAQMRMRSKTLISLLSAGVKYPVFNNVAKQPIMLSVVDGVLSYEKA